MPIEMSTKDTELFVKIANPLNLLAYFAPTRELFLSWLEISFVMVLQPTIGRCTESLFYILLWVCSNYSGPNNAVREDEKRKDMSIMMWVDTLLTLDQISDTKAGHISNDEYFEKRILDHYAPYFKDLKECSNELRCLFTASSNVTHVNAS